MARIHLSGVGLDYRGTRGGGVPALVSVELRVRAGELVAVVGPSGSGKSSLLRLVAGLEKPSRGGVFMDGRPVGEIPPSKREVFWLAQDGLLYPGLSVFKNLALGLERQGFAARAISQRVHALGERLGVAGRLEFLPEQLSRGERQRVALGRALLSGARVLLLDEPLTGLDPELRFQLKEEILSVRDETDATVLYVTHDAQEGLSMGDRVAVLDQGHLIQIGTPEEIYRSPGHRFVAGFLGYPPMNFVEGRIVREGEAVSFCSDHETGSKPAFKLEGLRQLGEAVGRRTILGIRPEHISVASMAADSSAEEEFSIRRIECTGAGSLIHLERGTLRLVVQESGATPLLPGSSVGLVVNPGNCIGFDGETFERLGKGDLDGTA